MRRHVVAAVLAALAAGAARAEEVTVPLRFDLPFVRRLLIEQAFTDPGPSAAVWRDGTGCGWLDLREPVVLDAAGSRLRVESRGDAQVGTPVGSERCLPVLRWAGVVEAFLEPGLDPATPAVTFRVVDSNLYDEERRKGLATGRLWDLVKAHVHPRLELLRIDVSRPVSELRAWLPLVLPGSAARLDALRASLALREPRVEGDAVLATLAFAVPPGVPAPPPAPEPAFAREELDRWDAFLTFVTKAAAREAPPAMRQAIMDVLLDGRHDILEALGAEAAAGGPDPVPGLFLRAWNRLGAAMREGAATGLPAETVLRYTAFIAAGDALAALLRLGPAYGVDLSADGLRRLARMLDPVSAADPVVPDDAVDPELRGLLGLDAPPPPPEIPPDVELEEEPLSWLPSLVGTAHAIDRPALARLNTWVPTPGDLPDYLRAVRALLAEVREEPLAAGKLDSAHHALFRHLVFATAWQESCWRQFVRRDGKLVPLRSPVGSVGIMQVNRRVWRGVYDQNGLLGDMAYNARAGTEILLHYLRDYAIARGENRRPGGADNLARATYAVYNGGPQHLTRYRARNPARSLKHIDQSFWEKFTAVRAGRELEVASCWPWGISP